MYLFEYLLKLNDECISAIQTAINVLSILPMLIDQYQIKFQSKSNQFKQKKELINHNKALIMDDYIVLLTTKNKRKLQQQKRFKQFEHSSSNNNDNINQSSSSISSIYDKNEFLQFFDEVVIDKNHK